MRTYASVADTRITPTPMPAIIGTIEWGESVDFVDLSVVVVVPLEGRGGAMMVEPGGSRRLVGALTGPASVKLASGSVALEGSRSRSSKFRIALLTEVKGTHIVV